MEPSGFCLRLFQRQTSWKQMFLFTKDGKLQNMDLMYAFFLGIAELFLNFLLGNRFTILLESLFPDMARAGKNLLGILIPAVFCGLIAFLLFRSFCGGGSRRTDPLRSRQTGAGGRL